VDDRVVELIEQFLIDGRNRSEENFLFFHKELVDHVIPKLAEEGNALPPSQALREIRQFLRRARDAGRIARIGIGQYELGGQEPREAIGFSVSREVAFRSFPDLVPSPPRTPESDDSPLLNSALDSLIRRELADVAALARSSTFMVKAGLQEVDVTALKGLSF
jgi:hypothetical protein